jgi:hypothetical protein
MSDIPDKYNKEKNIIIHAWGNKYVFAKTKIGSHETLGFKHPGNPEVLIKYANGATNANGETFERAFARAHSMSPECAKSQLEKFLVK